MALNQNLNLPDPDGFYEKLLDAHAGLSREQAALMDAKLILLLANHVGDPALIDQALATARTDLDQWPRRRPFSSPGPAVAIIGMGVVGKALGRAWTAAGRQVIYGLRKPSAEQNDFAASIGASVAPLGEAVRQTAIVTLAVPWSAVESALAGLGDLNGKILVDATNPLNYSPKGIELALGFSESGGERVASLAPGAKVVKAFNTTGADNMDGTGGYTPPAVMFVAGDDADAKAAVLELARAAGFRAEDAGPLHRARLLEPFAMLWISQAYGGRGRDFAFSLVEKGGA